jgi:hypothetical protein
MAKKKITLTVSELEAELILSLIMGGFVMGQLSEEVLQEMIMQSNIIAVDNVMYIYQGIYTQEDVEKRIRENLKGE